ncbi:MAG: hypothetical protein LBM75_00550 [Myxococcales bacterium]|jgi:hypothetical protein|nr:hypothetical protein [Myxococcales bacterium]
MPSSASTPDKPLSASSLISSAQLPASDHRQKTWHWNLLASAIGLLVVGRFFYPLEDPDLYWHMLIGRWILDNGEVPRSEHWNFFGLGQEFRAYSWMSESFFALIDRHFGLRGLWWCQGLFGVGLTALVATVFLSLSRSRPSTFVATLFFVFFVEPFVSVRLSSSPLPCSPASHCSRARFSRMAYAPRARSCCSGSSLSGRTVAIDGRTNILSRELSESYYRMERGFTNWRDFIERHRLAYE